MEVGIAIDQKTMKSNYKIQYQVQKSSFPLFLFWDSGTLSFSDTDLTINGDENYVISFAKIKSFQRSFCRFRTYIYISLKFDNKKINIRLPNKNLFDSTGLLGTEKLYQILNDKIKER